MKKGIALLLVILSLLFILAGCGGDSSSGAADPPSPPAAGGNDSDDSAGGNTSSDEPVYLAWAGPMTGDSQQYGDTAMEAIKIAVKDINADGGVLGRELVVDYYDDKNDPTEAVNVANMIIDTGKYTAVIGHFGSATCMVVAPIYQEAGLTMYSATCSHADMTSIGKYIFRNLLTQATEATAYADFLYTDMGYDTAGVIYLNDDWGKNVYDYFAARYEELGGTILVAENFISGQTQDFSPMLAKIKDANPDCFFSIAYYNDTAQMLIQSDALDLDIQKVVSTAVYKQELIDIAGSLADGILLLNIFPTGCELPAFTHVMDAYQENTGKMGDFHVMCNYDVTTQIANAINIAGTTDVDAVRDALAENDFDSISGTYSMSEIGDAERYTQPATIIDGQFAPYNPASK